MRTSIYLPNWLTFGVCILVSIYLALRGDDSISYISPLLSFLSEGAESLHVAFATQRPPGSKDAVEASPSPVGPFGDKRRRKAHTSLPDGLTHCINSFEQYPTLAERVIQRKYARYTKQTPAQKLISNKLRYHEHFDKAREGIEVNARFVELVAQSARKHYRAGHEPLEDEEDADFGVVDLAFGHLRRDWSTEGAEERDAVFPPILDGLEKHFGSQDRRKGAKVLVPGSGMGRLASDIADLGTLISTYQLI